MTLYEIPAAPPRNFQLEEFNFSVLGPDCAEEDFAAVTSSEAHLAGLFGSEWPKGMTWDRNCNDLVRHAQEFDSESAFAWVIRNANGGYLGCLYVRPADKARKSGEVYLWLQQSETSPERVADAVGLIEDWLAGWHRLFPRALSHRHSMKECERVKQ